MKRTLISLSFSAALALATQASYAGSYNRGAAVAYARQWAYSRNPDYRSYDNDCTNFVSQCLRAGGWQNSGWLYYSDWNWFHNGNGWHQETWSWNNAGDLFTYMGRCGRANRVYSFWDVQPGDVVFMSWYGPNWPTHAAIVTRVDSVHNVWLTQHSNDRMDKGTWEYVNGNPGMAFYAYHLRDSY